MTARVTNRGPGAIKTATADPIPRISMTKG